MKQGDTVMIFQDPITQQKPEGEATLLKLEHDGDTQQYWKVRFLTERLFKRYGSRVTI